jgi:hypothetical protein
LVTQDLAQVRSQCSEFGQGRCGQGIDRCESGDGGRWFVASEPVKNCGVGIPDIAWATGC